MKSFIDLCVSDILAKHAHELANTTVVFPSKRAMVFFKKSLGEQIESPIFMPKLTTIQDFCISRQNAAIPDDFTLVYLLYKSYKKFFTTNEPFEEFYPWGEMLLSDFDDIDKYKINAKDLFINIADIKEIDSVFSYLNEEQIAMISRFWDTTKITGAASENDVRNNFITLWNKLPHIYDDFKDALKSQNLCYEGLAIRTVAESSVERQDEIFGANPYIFLGFNALSKCEMTIFKFLQNRKQAFFYWDYDTYYKNDDSHEAGIFIRENIKNYPNELQADLFSNFCKEKDIRIVQTPNEISQAKLCGDLIAQQQSLENTAIILADEKLIVPLMNSIPNDIQYNVTLGYPLRSSAAYTLFESILDACSNKRGDKFYYKDVLRICENSLIPQDLQAGAKRLQSYIVDKKKITITEQECLERCKLDYIFNIDTNVNSYLESLISFIKDFCINAQLTDIDTSIFYTIFKELSTLKDIVEKNEIAFENISFINRLLRNTLQGKNIAIEGQPLEGLQVMGVLETRMLDFTNIIMTSVMDGNLPKTSAGGSFIPYNLRVAFGMPTIKEQSAMYSYYFYRLLQRSEHITLLYCENTGENKNEKSRFILQLLYESPFKNLSIDETNPNKTIKGITVDDISYNIIPQEDNDHPISKSAPEVLAYIDRLKNDPDKYLPPTALTKYIICPKQFYFSQIQGLRKPQEFDELPRPFDLGNYFHDAMETIYKPYTGKTIDENVISKILNDEQTIKSCILTSMKDNKAPENIANEQSKEFIATFHFIKAALSFDKGSIFKIIGLETKEAQIHLENGIKIGGIIDRLDLCKGTYRIIDYKTGRCAPDKLPDKLDIKALDDLFNSKNIQKEAFQTLLYAFIMKTLHPTQNYQPNLFYIQSISAENNRTTLRLNNEEIISFEGEIYEAFKEKITELINDLISTEGTFASASDDTRCFHCDYKAFCDKQNISENY